MNRIDPIGQNGPDGEIYLVEKVARAIAGANADQILLPKEGPQKCWELHIKQAMKCIDIVREWDKNGED